MNILLRKITIISDEDIQILNENVEKTCFGKTKVVESIITEKKQYEYWVEFHIDQGRFYYGERKPVEIENRNGLYRYITSTSHTKNGLDDSLAIISGIMSRTETIHPEYEIKLYQHHNITLFRQFDREKK